jgi:sigma-E factor negative regulatory protein RseA
MMNEVYKERLSAFMDGELHNDEELVVQLEQNPQLQGLWQRYHTIRDAMHQGLAPAMQRDFLDAVSAAIADEPAILAPRRRRFSARQVAKPAAGIAIAASIAMAVVLGVQSYRTNPELTTPSLAEAPAAAPATVLASAPASGAAEQRLNASQESKLNNYLVNHNEYASSFHVQGMVPYTRIVSFTPGERIAESGK